MDPENPRRLDFYYDQNSMLIGFRYNGQDYWYIRNGQNDIAGIIDSTGTQVVCYTYDSWGVPISVTGSMADTIGAINPFRYRGYYYDSETGLYYLNSRYYDPVVGRWISPEPNVYEGRFDENAQLISYNIYSFCANNPINNIDLTGEFVISTILIGAGIGAALGGIFETARQLMSGTSWSDLDVGSILIEMGSGAIAGGFLSMGLPPQVVMKGKMIINATTSVAHSLYKGDPLGTTVTKATVSVIGTKVAGNILGNKKPKYRYSGVITNRAGRFGIRSVPNAPTIISNTVSVVKQIINSVNSSSSSYYYTSGMSSFLTYSQAMNYGLI